MFWSSRRLRLGDFLRIRKNCRVSIIIIVLAILMCRGGKMNWNWRLVPGLAIWVNFWAARQWALRKRAPLPKVQLKIWIRQPLQSPVFQLGKAMTPLHRSEQLSLNHGHSYDLPSPFPSSNPLRLPLPLLHPRRQSQSNPQLQPRAQLLRRSQAQWQTSTKQQSIGPVWPVPSDTKEPVDHAMSLRPFKLSNLAIGWTWLEFSSRSRCSKLSTASMMAWALMAVTEGFWSKFTRISLTMGSQVSSGTLTPRIKRGNQGNARPKSASTELKHGWASIVEAAKN